MSDALVIGAGLAGLVAARDLTEAGLSVTVVESSAYVGGHARTTEQDGFAWEWGPHTLTSTAHATHALVDALGIRSELVRVGQPSTRYIFRDGQMRALPNKLTGVFRSRALSRRGWLRALAEPLIRSSAPHGETVADFFARRLGVEAMEMLVSSFVSGIHAGDVRQLGIEDAFPKVARWEREHGSVVRGALASRRASGTEPSHGITAFRRGTGALSEALASSLRQPVQLNTPVQALSRAESGFVATAGSAKLYAQHVVVATPPPVTWSLLGEWMNLPALGPMAPIAVVHLMGTDGEPPTGFGVLVPPSQRGSGRAVRALGVLFVSSQVPARAPGDGWLLTVFLGGTTDSSALELSDEALVGVAVRDVASITGFTPVTRHTAVFRQVSAIPQMTPGHLQRVQAFKRSVSSIPGLAVAGNWLGGVSVEHAVQSGHDAASQLLAQEV